LYKATFDSALGSGQPGQGSIPGLQLLGVHLDVPPPLPTRNQASSLAVTDEVGFQPAGQAVLAAGPHQATGDQDEGAIGVGSLGGIVACFGSAEVWVEDLPPAELIEPGADEESRPPVPGLQNVHVGWLVGQVWLTVQDTLEAGEQGLHEVLAAEVGDDTLFDLAVLALGFDDADVLIDSAAGGGNFDSADIHVVRITTGEGAGKSNPENRPRIMSLRSQRRSRPAPGETQGKSGFREKAIDEVDRVMSNMG